MAYSKGRIGLSGSTMSEVNALTCRMRLNSAISVEMRQERLRLDMTGRILFTGCGHSIFLLLYIIYVIHNILPF